MTSYVVNSPPIFSKSTGPVDFEKKICDVIQKIKINVNGHFEKIQNCDDMQSSE
jgi:hypothetical protein